MRKEVANGVLSVGSFRLKCCLEIMCPVNVFRVLQVTVTLKYLVQIQRNAHSVFYLSAFKRRLPYDRSTTFLGQPSQFSQKHWSLQEALTFRSSKASLLVHITQRGISQCLIFTFASNFINTDHCENWCRY